MENPFQQFPIKDEKDDEPLVRCAIEMSTFQEVKTEVDEVMDHQNVEVKVDEFDNGMNNFVEVKVENSGTNGDDDGNINRSIFDDSLKLDNIIDMVASNSAYLSDQHRYNGEHDHLYSRIIHDMESPRNMLKTQTKGTRSRPTVTNVLYVDDDELIVFICDHCELSFSRKSFLLVHMQRKHNYRPFRCPVDNCNHTVKVEGDLRKHFLRVHGKGPSKEHKCGHCNKDFTTKFHLNQHMRSHTGEKPFKCEKCDKAYSQRTHLKIHVNEIHLGLKPYACIVCGLAFSRNTDLKKHMRLHTGEKPFKCRFCNCTYTNSSCCRKHERTAHLDNNV